MRPSPAFGILIRAFCAAALLASGVPAAAGPAAPRNLRFRGTAGAPSGMNPMPLLSRGRAVNLTGSGAPSSTMALTNAAFDDFAWHVPTPTSAAIQIPPGPTQVMVRFRCSPNGNFILEPGLSGGMPTDYRIEVSPDGAVWTQVASVTGNPVAERVHRVPFTGMSWLRLSVTRVDDPGNRVSLSELDVHDASLGTGDTWIFLGDSITALSMTRHPGTQPSFAELIHAAHPDTFPVMITGGVGGTATPFGIDNIDAWLDLFPDVTHWALGWGTNESGASDTSAYRQRMQTLIDKIKARNHVPVVPRLPFMYWGTPPNHTPNPNTPFFAVAADDLTLANGLPAGPDLYSWFQAHQDQLSDGVHLTSDGAKAFNRLWSEAVEPLYQ